MTEETPMRRCSRKENCIHPESKDGWLPATLTYFRAKKGGKFGLNSICRECECAENKEYLRAWRKSDAGKAYLQEYNSRPDVIEKRRARDRVRNRSEARKAWRKAWLKTPKGKAVRSRASKRNYQKPETRARKRESQRNPIIKERRKARRQEYLKTERGRSVMLIHKQRRRARKSGLASNFTKQDWQAAIDYFGHKCAACGKSGVRLVADHWIPLSAPDCPGTVASNIVPLCRKCNGEKWARPPMQWLVERFGRENADEIFRKIETFLHSKTKLEG